MHKIIKSLLSLVLAFLGLYTLVSYVLLWEMVSAERQALTLDQPDESRCQFEAVSFPPRGDDFKLEGWLLKPKRGKAQFTLIFVHGIGANRISNPYTMSIAYDLVSRGFQVLLFDLRTQGLSEGDFASAGYYEKFDVLGAFDFLVKEKRILAEELGLLGFSMGGATALLAASIEPKIKALAMDSPYSDARKLVAQETSRATGVPYTVAQLFVPMVRLLAEALYKIDLDQMVPMEAVSRLKYPILLVHGDKDQVLPHSHSEKIHKNAPKGSKLFITPGSDHTSSYGKNKKNYIKRLLDYYLTRTAQQLF